MRDLRQLNVEPIRLQNVSLINGISFKTIKHLSVLKPDGFTIDLQGNFITSGFVVGCKETQNSFGDEGIYKVLEFAQLNGLAVGGWLHDSKYYYDACKIFDNYNDALKFARVNNQIAFYSLDDKKTFYVPETFSNGSGIDSFSACSVIEQFCDFEPIELDYLKAFSFIGKNGLYKSLQGFYGRGLFDLVNNGYLDKNFNIL